MSLTRGLLMTGIKVGGKLLSPLLKVLKGGKSLKLILGGSSAAAYSYLFTPKFALILMGSIAFHEAGHLLAMRYFGMETKGMYFIPMLGAAAVSEEEFPTHRAEAFIAAAGPIFGLALALATAGVYVATGWTIAAAAAGWMAMVNAFNLVPVKPLDGGRILSALSFSMSGRTGLLVLLGTAGISATLAWVVGLSLLYVLIPIGLFEILDDYRRTGANPLTIPVLGWTIGEHRLSPEKKLYEQTLLQSTDVVDVTLKPPEDRPEEAKLSAFKSNNAVIDTVEVDVYSTENGFEDEVTLATQHNDSWYSVKLRESTFWAVVDESTLVDTKPGLSKRGMVVTGVTYVALTAVLLGVMLSMQHVPGAEAALNALS